ncbi:hypothetical protein [Azotosporobacter soli]|uniref:hypothetical protein n=1 Tax=Azotosporobacter soli TaxID=3055040 RepID=UPI0031FEECB4
MKTNLIDFSQFHSAQKLSIDTDAAKHYFLNEVLPYASKTSLERLIIANQSNDSTIVHQEMMRIFIESQLTRPETTAPNSLEAFFTASPSSI